MEKVSENIYFVKYLDIIYNARDARDARDTSIFFEKRVFLASLASLASLAFIFYRNKTKSNGVQGASAPRFIAYQCLPKTHVIVNC